MLHLRRFKENRAPLSVFYLFTLLFNRWFPLEIVVSHCKSKSRSQTLNPDAVQLSTFIFYIHFRGNSGNLIFNVASDYSVHSKKKQKKQHSLSGTLVLLVAYLCMQSSVLMFDHYPVHTLLLLSNPDFSVLWLIDRMNLTTTLMCCNKVVPVFNNVWSHCCYLYL